MLLSVIIPCYNAQDTLAKALASIPPSTTSFSLELILVDDGSTDNSINVARRIRPDAKIITQKNQGASAARNAGIQSASGKWIQFLDSDDYLSVDSLSLKIEAAHAQQADVVVSDWAEVTAPICSTAAGSRNYNYEPLICQRTADWNTLFHRGPEIACATSFWAPPAALLFSKSIVNKINGFRTDLPIIQDARFLFDAAYEGARFTHLPKTTAFYRVWHNSLSRRDPLAFWLDCFLNAKQIEELWMIRDGRLNINQTFALRQIYTCAAHGLAREGSHEAFAATNRLLLHGGHFSSGLTLSTSLLRILGSSRTKLLYKSLQEFKQFIRSLREHPMVKLLSP